jgi:hypothetical protein
MAGRLEQAHKAMARLRQLNPVLRLSNLKDVLSPFRRVHDLARYEEGLRQAGCPSDHYGQDVARADRGDRIVRLRERILTRVIAG